MLVPRVLSEIAGTLVALMIVILTAGLGEGLAETCLGVL